jgi:ERCC4-type nuclease
MIIRLDFRETELHSEITKLRIDGAFSKITVETDNLPIGDIIICQDDGKEQLIIERKTLADLAASIRDGRYNEQSFRLNQCALHNHSIIYLLEGNIHRYKSSKYGRSINKEALISAMTSIMWSKGFSIYRSVDTIESALWLLQTADKLGRIKEKNFYHVDDDVSANASGSANASDNSSNKDYTAVSKRVKKANITPENIGSIMLAQIPSVSTASACAIMDKYKTIPNLIEAIKKDDKALHDITTLTKSGKSRKLTKVCTSNVYNFLLGKSGLVEVDI